jgi:hypothetical protein
MVGIPDNYKIVTDIITIENLNEINLNTTQFIDYSPISKLDLLNSDKTLWNIM